MDIDKKIEELKNKEDRLKKMKDWRSRFDSLREMGMDTKTFCQKYGFNNTYISHQIAGRAIAKEDLFNDIEDALKKEGV